MNKETRQWKCALGMKKRKEKRLRKELREIEIDIKSLKSKIEKVAELKKVSCKPIILNVI